MTLDKRVSKSQHSLRKTNNDNLPSDAQDGEGLMSLVTLDPSNLMSICTNDRPNRSQFLERRPFTAPQMSQRQEPLILFNIPGQVPQ